MSLSDPQRPPGKTPPRAEPLQPDKPTSGDDRQRSPAAKEDEARRQAEQSREERRVQEDNAVENVRDA